MNWAALSHSFYQLAILAAIFHQSSYNNASVEAYPSMIVQHSKTRCMTVDVGAMETFVIKLKSDDIPTPTATLQITASDPDDGWDDDDDDDDDSVFDSVYKKIPIDEKEILYDYDCKEDMLVNICLYVPYRQEVLLRTSLEVDVVDTEDYREMLKKRKLSQESGLTEEELKSQQAASNHFTMMEKTYEHLVGTASRLVKDSGRIKHQEGGFQHASEKLNRRYKWFKIIQVVIVSIAGVIQANHVLSTLRKRHVIY